MEEGSPAEGGQERRASSGQRTGRHSSTARAIRSPNTSHSSVRRPRTPDEQSLTSFPSLSPTLDKTPHAFLPPLQLPDDTPNNSLQPTSATLEELISPRPGGSGRSSLFDNSSRDVRNIPGTVHHQSDDQIRQMLARVGPVRLVRQLAEDLARRDSQVTTIQRHAERRERLLRSMLRECEVAQTEIERRLREMEAAYEKDQRRASSSHPVSMRSASSEAQSGLEDSIHERMVEAFGDSLTNTPHENGYASQPRSRTSSGRSLEPGFVDVGALQKRNEADSVKGWRSYFSYGSNTARPTRQAPPKVNDQSQTFSANRTSETNRVPLTNDIFRPPPPTKRSSSAMESLRADLTKDISRPQAASSQASHKPTSSVTSWAVKLVTGRSSQNTDGPEQKNVHPSAQSRTSQRDSKVAKDNNSAKANVEAQGLRAFGPSGTIKKIPSQVGRHPMTSMLPPSSPVMPSFDQDSSPGPVEMDRILPDNTRPPTLLSNELNNLDDDAEILTDRFGFIYDQRRRRRQKEAAAILSRDKRASRVETLENHRRPPSPLSRLDSDDQSVEGVDGISQHRPDTPASLDDVSTTKTRWQDLLRFGSSTGELLSHTPAAGAGESVHAADTTTTPSKDPPPRIVLSKRGSEPVLSPNPEPTPSRVSSDNAELARPHQTHLETKPSARNVSVSPSRDPVKSLLDQLTEVHDSLQKEKTTRWNDFLRKVRAERRKTSDANSASDRRNFLAAMPEAHLGDGELVGITGLGNEGKFGKAKWNDFRNLVLRGIPVAYRAKIWSECSGATTLRVPGYYDDLVRNGQNDPAVVQQIQMDITRTLTDNIFFRRGTGVAKLREVLLAYARRNPEVGYCQGMNLITANLLLILPAAEDAFWVLASLVENILPEKYYDNSLLTSRADQLVLRQFVTDLLPQLSGHLDSMSIELEALTFQWFLSVFTDCLSAEALFRVWDVVLCMQDGSTFLFQVALALLKLNEKQLLACDNPAEVYAYINQRMTDHAISIDGLIKASEALKKMVRGEEVRSRRKVAVAKEEEALRIREAIRKGKSKVTAPEIATEAGSRDTAATVKETRHKPTEHEDEIMTYGELTIRTPMPVDEEAEWRA